MWNIFLKYLILLSFAISMISAFSIKPIRLEKSGNKFGTYVPDVGLSKYANNETALACAALERVTGNAQCPYFILESVTSRFPLRKAAPTLKKEFPKCLPTVTELSRNDRIYCKDDLIFEEHFDESLFDRWVNEVRLSLDLNDAEFVFYNGSASVANGTMKIRASIIEQSSLIRGVIDLVDRCTSFVFKECHLEAQPPFYLPPIVSARVNSRKSFSFKYGRIEVRAKLPKGDWLVPLILLEPTTPKYGSDHYINGEMRIAFTRGNEQLQVNDTNIDGQRLFGGAVFSTTADLRHQFMANVTLDKVNGIDEHFGNQYHNYSMLWSPTEIVLSVDNYVYGKIPTNFKDKTNENAWRMGPENAPVDQMYHITLGLSVGGNGDFPKDTVNKPWENRSPKAIVDFYNHHAEWEPTWENPELEVDYVKVWAI